MGSEALRDLILLAGLAATLPLIARTPILGLLAWIWIALMNPQREVFGFLHGFELNVYVAGFTALAWIASPERKRIPFNPLTISLLLFSLWACVSNSFSLDHGHSDPIWNRTMKTMVLALAVIVLADSRSRVQAVVWMMMISIGYYALKGGGFVLLTGGRQRVFGPENSMISDNNALGLALVVFAPLMNYLRETSRVGWVRLSCLAVMGAALLAVLGTYSRGALLATAAAGAAFAAKSRYGVVLVLAGAVLAVSLPSLLPTSWFDRMSTIQSYNEDASFEGRVAAWRTSMNIARARPLIGGGFSAVEVGWIDRQFHSEGSLDWGRAAHSIYFQVLGDTGFVGLGLYLAALASAALNTVLVLRAARGRPELEWAAALARMLQISLVALTVGGAALSMAYYDGFIVMLALSAALLHVARKPVSDAWSPQVAAPRWRHLASARPSPSAVS